MENKTLLTSLLPIIAACSLSAQTIYIDFGDTDSTGNWNNFDNSGLLTTYTGLIDFNTGLATSVSMTVNDIFAGKNTSGGTNGFGAYEANGSIDTWYVTDTNSGQLTFALTAFTTYDFSFLSARNHADERIANFALTSGASNESTAVSAATPTGGAVDGSNIGTISGFTTDATGSVTLDVTFVSGSSKFAYLNGITIAQVPEPSSFALLAGALALGSVMVRRRR